jgi:lactate dehydrogenase-like 2-hydroxyacid dehydrogenase
MTGLSSAGAMPVDSTTMSGLSVISLAAAGVDHADLQAALSLTTGSCLSL